MAWAFAMAGEPDEKLFGILARSAELQLRLRLGEFKPQEGSPGPLEPLNP